SPDIRVELDSLKPEYLDQRVADLVLLAEAERRGITVSDEEADVIVQSSIAGIPEEELDAVLDEAGFSDLDQFRDLVIETEQIQRLVDELYDELEFSDEEVGAWFEENSAEFTQDEQVCASHILVDDVETAEGLLEEL